MSWEGAEALLARLNRWRGAGWVEHEGGGLQVCHTPSVGPKAYLHWLYPGLSEERLAQTEAAYERPLPAEYRRFLGWANGASFFDHLGLNGSHVRGTGRESLDRSGTGMGQPISLDYGNRVGRPAGTPVTAWVIGTISGYSGQGCLLLRQDGGVTLCSQSDADDVAVSWKTFGEMLIGEFDRMAVLNDGRRDDPVSHEAFLPEAARRWERPRSDHRSGLLDRLLRRR